MTESVEIGNATLYHGDCMDILPQLSGADAVITDPPYGISYVSARRTQGPTEMLKNDEEAPVEVVPLLASAIKEGGALYLATRFDVSGLWSNAIDASGLSMKTPIYWDKGNHTSGDLEGDFGAQIEIFMFAHKGRHKLRGRRLSNLWHVPRDKAGDHPTPKPVVLMERMVAASTDAGGLVIDPFMGSGSTGVACANLQRRFIGIELERRYFDLSCERIDRAHSQGRLFA
jgi:site-specific DNA-methyltransferase (adenine-specific)